MTRRRRRSRGVEARGRKPKTATARPRLPKSGYREYLERCESVGRRPEDFMTYLTHARRWRKEYRPAKDRSDFALVRELEELLCV